MAQTVAKNKLSIGYIGIGYLNDTLKPVAVDGVAGTAKTALDGTYPVSRYLYMFTKGWPTGDVLNFINFVLSDQGQKVVAESGFVPLR